MNKKTETKRNLLPKSDVQFADISPPFGFKHDLHIGKEKYQERPVDVDDGPVSPRPSNENCSEVVNMKTLDEQLNTLSDVIVESLERKIAEPIRQTQAQILFEVQARNKTFQSVYTQTTPDNTERVIIAEFEESESYRTEPKILYQEMAHVHLEPSQSITRGAKNDDQGAVHYITSKTPMTLDFGRFSLRLRERPVSTRPRPKSAIDVKRDSCDERECLAHALQFHVEDLVDRIIFHESELPDCLLAEGCLTEDECASVRKLRDRKDQVRVLLSLIKGRDLRVLRGFMKHIEQHNEDVAAKIIEKFEENKRDGIRRKLCFLCQLEKQFNVKHVIDSLWAIQIIDDGLYNTIIYSEAPIGAQETLWKKVIHSLNFLDPQKAELAQNKLLTCLTSKNLFTHLADGIKNMLIKNHGKLTCSCEPKLRLPKINAESISGESCFPDSSSDGTPNDGASSVGTYNPSSKPAPIADNRPVDNISGAVPEETLSNHKAQMLPKTYETNETVQHTTTPNAAQPTLRKKPVVPKKPVLDGTTRHLKIATSNAAQTTPRKKPVVPKKPVLDGITHRLKIAPSNTACCE
ncbi:uncharacterized protein LOC123530337 [Mercenaria mercenaria]|uniref:uncharacterized protein LOC123530337 n=1 Tax=Mercenaria mercenaria TaxID=6596 RepID=UPI00234F9EB1|nr:uncharacterized protein LOC123530337 [Mercenaria mercenaria]